jgi:transposase
MHNDESRAAGSLKLPSPKENNMVYRNIGVDLGVTAKHKAHMSNEYGEKIGTFSFHITKEGLDALCEKALKGACQGTQLRILCEPTSMAWFPVAVYARNNGHEMVRVKSHKTHDLRKCFSRNKKNDSMDANVLSKMPMVDPQAVAPIYLPQAPLYTMERYNRQQERLTRELATIKNRLTALYHWVLPGLTRCFEDPFDKRARSFYRNFSNPFKAREAGKAGIEKVLEPAGRQTMKEGLCEKLYQTVTNSCALYENSSEWIDFESIQAEVEIELAHFDLLESCLMKVKERIKVLYEQVYPSKQLETLKGIGPNLGASIISVLGDPHRFGSQRKLRSFVGLIPKQDDSGESSKKGLPLTQEGPARLRRDLFIAADVARQWDPQLAKIYYTDMVHKGHCHNQAVCSVMTHLINRILCVLKEARPYRLLDNDGNPVSPRQARTIIQEQFIVPEEVRQRTRSRKSRKNRKEEPIQNLFARQHNAPQNSYPVPLENIIQNFEKVGNNAS